MVNKDEYIITSLIIVLTYTTVLYVREAMTWLLPEALHACFDTMFSCETFLVAYDAEHTWP